MDHISFNHSADEHACCFHLYFCLMAETRLHVIFNLFLIACLVRQWKMAYILGSGTLAMCLTCVAGNQLLISSSVAFLGTLARTWMRSTVAGPQTSTLVWTVDVLRGGLTHWIRMSALRIKVILWLSSYTFRYIPKTTKNMWSKTCTPNILVLIIIVQKWQIPQIFINLWMHAQNDKFIH